MAQCCSIDGCENFVFTAGWCQMHYWRWRRHGSTDPRPPREPQPCIVPGCEKRRSKREWCVDHYRRWLRHGDPTHGERALTPAPVPLTDLQVGWLAGLYEGEGTAGARTVLRGPSGAKSTAIKVSICMTDRDVIDRVNELFPSRARVRARQRNADGPRKTVYEWTITQRARAAEFLSLILPHLGERRRAQAEAVIAVATDPGGGLGSGWRKRTHCKYGHEFTPENMAHDTQGYRVCRTCRRRHDIARREARRARA